MTVSTTTNKATVQGNGATTVFTYSFPIGSGDNYNLTYTDTNGTQTVLGNTSFTITGVGGTTGGTFTYPTSGSPIANGTSLTLLRTTPFTQTTSLQNQAGFYALVVEGMGDTIVKQVQQLAEQIGRAVVISATDTTGLNVTLPSAVQRAGLALVFDSTGNATAGAVTGTVISSAMIPVVQSSTIAGALTLLGALPIAGGTITGNLAVNGTTSLVGNLTANGTNTFNGNTTFANATTVSGAMAVSGAQNYSNRGVAQSQAISVVNGTATIDWTAITSNRLTISTGVNLTLAYSNLANVSGVIAGEIDITTSAANLTLSTPNTTFWSGNSTPTLSTTTNTTDRMIFTAEASKVRAVLVKGYTS